MSGSVCLMRLLLVLSAALPILPAHSQTFPNQPLKIIVPYSAGGATDLVIRAFADTVRESLGQPIIVENRPGGGTITGMNACAKAPADGYTLCVTNSDSLSFAPLLFSRLPYDPAKDLIGITKVASAPSGLFINGTLPLNSFAEVIAYAKANPGKLNFGSFGAGSVGHLYAEWFRRELQADMTHVPYRGSAQVATALISNEVQIAWLALSNALEFVAAGAIKPIAIDYGTRAPQLPNIPTLAELNANPKSIQSYFGLYAPAATPTPVIERLNSAFTSALRDKKVQEKMATAYFTTNPTTVDEINQFRRDEAEIARRMASTIGLKPVDAPE
jgi:tripartite-type tricarboxylate transporter receptor subunit TctC